MFKTFVKNKTLFCKNRFPFKVQFNSIETIEFIMIADKAKIEILILKFLPYT